MIEDNNDIRENIVDMHHRPFSWLWLLRHHENIWYRQISKRNCLWIRVQIHSAFQWVI